MWLSEANEDSQRASNHQSSSSSRSQATLCLAYKFPKCVRLRTRLEFRRIQREGRRFQGQFLIFHFFSERLDLPDDLPCRLGITVSRKFGPAVARNRLKRRLRELFRIHQHVLNKINILHISPRNASPVPTFDQVQEEFRLFLNSLGMIPRCIK